MLLTSYFWEGSAALDALIRSQVGLTHVVVQRPWWGRRSTWHARMAYYKKSIRYNRRPGPRRYFGIEAAALRSGLKIKYIDDINTAALTWDDENVRLIVVAGSRIIRPPVVGRFRGRLVNFHSGLLPAYRGPYSEFWAMYHHQPEQIGSSVQLIDDGIDTGPILATRATGLPHPAASPEEAHHHNVLDGVELLAQTVAGYLAGAVTPSAQSSGGHTYHYPDKLHLREMHERIGRPFRVDFIE